MTAQREQTTAANARRLTTYLVAGVGALGAAHNAQGAVIYTPGPFVANNSTIDIDFDGDSSAEFTITHSFQAGTKKIPVPFDNLAMANGLGATGQQAMGAKPTRLASGVSVSSADSFNNLDPLPNLASTFGSGNWNGGQTGFIGVRFDLGGGYRYGWVELLTPATGLSGNTGSVLGYAYEDSGAGILTGDTGAVSAVPEPNTLLLLATGAMGVLALKRRKQQ